MFTLFIALNASIFSQETTTDSNYAQAGEEQNPDAYIIPGQTTTTLQNNGVVKKTKTNKNEPIELGSSTMFSYIIAGVSVKQSDVVFYNYPELNEIGFLVKDWVGKVNISFDSKMSKIICSAFRFYESEFDNKQLRLKDSSTAKEYGEGESHYRKGTIGVTGEFFPVTSVGYVFVKNSPYFAITLWPVKAKSARSANKTDDGSELTKTTLLFNKAQARALVKVLSENSGE